MSPLRRLAALLCCGPCLVALVLAGCANMGETGHRTSTNAGPTASAIPRGAVIPHIQRIDLGNFQASVAFPAAHGIVLFGNPGTVGQPIGEAGAFALYYYDNAAKTVSVIATPTPTSNGVPRGIRLTQAAGDWAVYYVGDAGDFNWEIWALNLVTMERRLVASASGDQTPLAFRSLFFTDGTSLVWPHAVLVNGQRQTIMVRYDLASATSRTLMTVPATTVIIPQALVNGSLVFTEESADGSANKSVWLWKLDDAAPRQIVADAGSDALNFTVNDQYVVWDRIHQLSLTLYDRATGKQTDGWQSPCLRPHLVVNRPYLVCVDWDANAYRLVRVPSGEDASFYEGQESETLIFTDNTRAYWVATSASSPYGNQIDYFDVPTS
ncbi:MAG TPA: hypothetical protein VF818_09475 [Ktedonobacterales bacterium]